MITRGELQTINFNENTCTVRIPLFETVGTKEPMILPALFVIQPGACNGYQVGDKVWVAFEGGDSYSHAVILGKLYIDVATEKSINGGGMTCADLTVKNSAVLPANTKISFDPENSIKNIDVSLTRYSSLKDIVTAISNQSVKITQILENGISSNSSPANALQVQQVSSITIASSDTVTISYPTLPENATIDKFELLLMVSNGTVPRFLPITMKDTQTGLVTALDGTLKYCQWNISHAIVGGTTQTTLKVGTNTLWTSDPYFITTGNTGVVSGSKLYYHTI